MRVHSRAISITSWPPFGSARVELLALGELTADNAPQQLRQRARLAWRSSRPNVDGFWQRFRPAVEGLGLAVVDQQEAQALMANAAPGETVLMVPDPEPGQTWPEGLALCWCSTARATIRRGW